MKRTLLAGSAALLFLLVNANRVDAQVVVACPTCASLAEELLSDAKQAQQYLTQVAQLQTELNQYSNMVTNTVRLPTEIFAGVQNDIMQVRNIANAASLLTGNSDTILTRLQSASGYVNMATNVPANIGSQFTIWSSTLGKAGNTLGSTLGVQQSQLSSYTALQAAIQTHSQTAAGQMQAIQAGNELASLTNTQLQQIQTTLTAAAQEQATRDIVAADQQAAQEAAMLRFLQYQPVATTGYQGF